MDTFKRAFSVWRKKADWPKNTQHIYIWADNENEAKEFGKKALKTQKRNVVVLEMPLDFKTPYSYPN